MAAFDALQSNTGSALSPNATSAANAAGATAATQAYGIVGQPDTSKPASLGTIINQLLGKS